jgi:gamma-glutamylcyclotransferase (GGCT)/AIG2-like uncharacterized protein YtfP
LPNHLFVYGTLRRGSDNEFARLLAARGQCIGEACVAGRLYDFGRYPGARQADQPDQSILGEIFYFKEPGAVLAALDDYEGPEYERTMVSATHRQGHTIDCWIYWYTGPEAGRLIASGDWFQR